MNARVYTSLNYNYIQVPIYENNYDLQIYGGNHDTDIIDVTHGQMSLDVFGLTNVNVLTIDELYKTIDAKTLAIQKVTEQHGNFADIATD